MLTKHLNIYLSRQISGLPPPNEVWHYEAGRIEAVEIESSATEKHLSLSLAQMEKGLDAKGSWSQERRIFCIISRFLMRPTKAASSAWRCVRVLAKIDFS